MLHFEKWPRNTDLRVGQLWGSVLQGELCPVKPVPKRCIEGSYEMSFHTLPNKEQLQLNLRIDHCKVLNTFREVFDTFSFLVLLAFGRI